MTGFIRSIRGIERTNVYAPIQAINRYASYPYREGEPQLPPNSERDWNYVYKEAADSAAKWVRTAKQAQYDLDRLMWDLSRQFDAGMPVTDHIHNLTRLLNDLESQYLLHAGDLKPGLWASIELALQHPAAKELGLQRGRESGKWVVDLPYFRQSQQPKGNLSLDAKIEAGTYASANSGASNPFEPASAPRMKRLLLGADGMLTGLKHALTYADHQKAVDLLQLRLPTSLPYAAYYGSIQSYWPLPTVGIILNRYL
ncbi:hypothetical protein [Paenibacillus prosopidis]|uniref:Uncharacterized protein n=1 Tax=Paenibacillus prosopidis TaxID=630520 RepID=A0A368VKM8_9BACL|nr:hypothetical protein [Paenibacillus prosopidis]RCW42050.1 hypothetical protein DFP97_11931 [Paenibacillus prosopidis]